MRLKAVTPSIAAFTVAGLFRMMPLKAASGFGGWIGRTFGPRTRRHRTAVYNLRKALPDLSEPEMARVLEGMWDNFGRMLGEYLHLDAFARMAETGHEAIVFEGLENLEQVIKSHGKAILIGGHFGNWEVSVLLNRRVDVDYKVVYHAIHEPYVDRLVLRCRSKINPNLVDSKKGSKAIVAALKGNAFIGLLVDQKPRHGPFVPFFGDGAKTTTTPAKLALRYRVPIVPVRVARREGPSFKITIYPPLATEGLADDDAGVTRITGAINDMLEGWIREDPAQWHWVHRRWPDSPKK